MMHGSHWTLTEGACKCMLSDLRGMKHCHRYLKTLHPIFLHFRYRSNEFSLFRENIQINVNRCELSYWSIQFPQSLVAGTVL